MSYWKILPPPKRYPDEVSWRGNCFDVGARLIRAAWHMAFSKDPATITLREVTLEVGVCASAAYHHFKDRDQLLGELAWGGLVTMGHDLGELFPGAEKLEKGLIPGICRVWLGFAQARPRHYAHMFSPELADPARFADVLEKRNNLRKFLRIVVLTELDFEVPDAEADVLFCTLHGVASLIAAGVPRPPDAVVAETLEWQLVGMKKKLRSQAQEPIVAVTH